MRFEARLTGDAAALARAHKDVLERLPATFHASILVELEKWPTLFAPEQAYQRALLEHLAGLPDAERLALFSGIARVEGEAGCGSIRTSTPGRFQDEAQAALRKTRLLAEWRKEVDGVFQRIQPALDAALHPADAPRRLVVQVYGSGISIQANRLWSRFRNTGVRVPLALEGVNGAEPFLRLLFSGTAERDSTPTLFATARRSAGLTPLDSWIIESGQALHTCCESGVPDESSNFSHTGLSYERLRGYRDELTRALYSKIQAGVASPQEFAAYARSLRITPEPGVMRNTADVVLAFVRDVFLTGNGTLFVNNTFAEWSAVQALRRAQPRMLVVRYGVRDKMKPFSSLLLFSQPRASDQIPMIEDPVGSFVDVEQLSYYVWLSAEKSAAYRKRTLYLFLAEGVDEMLAMRSDAAASSRSELPKASLPDVCATMARWLGVTPPASGQAIAGLVG
jgi:hypothetical protein